MPHRAFGCLTSLLVLVTCSVLADGPADNVPDRVRPVPKPGIDVPDDVRRELEDGLAKLRMAIEPLAQHKDRKVRDLLPDIRIYEIAVDRALKDREFFDKSDLTKASALLKEGQQRAEELANGSSPWTKQTGLVVRGYVSELDGSVQPYGLVVPESYRPGGNDRFRLDVWFHGRGETLSEVNFLADRRRNPGTFTPPDTIVLHPYGRFCNANKLAGEVDVPEAIADVRGRYRVDEDRIAVRGFSMGGAACWHMAVHYPDRWFAANPGAGFSETPRFLKVFQSENLKPAWYEEKLWQLYDCDKWAANLKHCPTVAYSGELDNQKQAADVMDEALEREGIDLVHVIGPATKHAYHPASKTVVEAKLASLAAKGRERFPAQVTFVTSTLKYNAMHWVTVDALGEHWSQARVDAEIEGPSAVQARTKNVEALTLALPSGWCPLDITKPVSVTLDGKTLTAPRPLSDRSWAAHFVREDGHWKAGTVGDGLRKRHDLQGPIDDALMTPFLFVRPTGTSAHPKVQAWVEAEMARAVTRWRRQMRGEVRIKDDTKVTEQDSRDYNLILWGDPQSNKVLSSIAADLPIRWGGDSIQAGAGRFDAQDHALILVHPNPKAPSRYVVLNSGFTYREYDDLNNARQVPKLPDWAVVDLKTPPNSRWPGKIADAGFFGERWELKETRD